MGVNVSVNLSGMASKLNGASLMNARRKVLNQMESDMQPFVPYRQGNLMNDTTISLDATELIYHVPYAKAQFYGVVGSKYPVRQYTRTNHPKATKRWDLRAKAMYGEDWAKVAKRALLKEMN